MKIIFSFIFIIILTSFTTLSFADPSHKFQDGVRDVLMSPLQVSENVKSETANAKFLPFALVGGLLKGSFYMAKKIVTGTIVVVTAPLDSLHK